MTFRLGTENDLKTANKGMTFSQLIRLVQKLHSIPNVCRNNHSHAGLVNMYFNLYRPTVNSFGKQVPIVCVFRFIKPGFKYKRRLYPYGRQLAYVARNLRYVEGLIAKTSLTELGRKQYKDLLVISELYRQQRLMHTSRSHQVDDRIVNIHQPHVRPIVREKAKAKVKFGNKVAMSLVNGYAMIEKMSWDYFNEGTTLIASVEMYKTRFGYYPKEILADHRKKIILPNKNVSPTKTPVIEMQSRESLAKENADMV